MKLPTRSAKYTAIGAPSAAGPAPVVRTSMIRLRCSGSKLETPIDVARPSPHGAENSPSVRQVDSKSPSYLVGSGHRYRVVAKKPGAGDWGLGVGDAQASEASIPQSLDPSPQPLRRFVAAAQALLDDSGLL